MKRLLLCLPLLLFSCAKDSLSPLERTMISAHPAMLNVFHDPDLYQIQIIYTEITRDSIGKAHFTDFDFRLNNDHYFYPASTVKLPMAVLALEYVSTNTVGINLYTAYTTSRDSLSHTIADDVRQIFAVSDNEAYNRLYELIGRDRANNRLRELGLAPIRLSHRLSTANAGAAIRDTLKFLVEKDTLRIFGIPDTPIEKLSALGLSKGMGFMQNDTLIEKPMDFSEKNYFPLKTQHELMKRIRFPENYSEEKQFKLSPEAAQLLSKVMHEVPRKAGYNEATYYDSYGKFFLYGDNKERIPETTSIYNKVGYAYGTLTETAHIIDKEQDIEFLLSATILVNDNRVFNDDTYEYDTIGIPFLAQLGREIYTAEYSRKRR